MYCTYRYVHPDQAIRARRYLRCTPSTSLSSCAPDDLQQVLTFYHSEKGSSTITARVVLPFCLRLQGRRQEPCFDVTAVFLHTRTSDAGMVNGPKGGQVISASVLLRRLACCCDTWALGVIVGEDLPGRRPEAPQSSPIFQRQNCVISVS